MIIYNKIIYFFKISNLKIIIIGMGNNINKDNDLKVCIVLDNIVYTAGEVVTGRVCIRATAHRPYQYLYISIIGSEGVHWS